ncbi:hypothetical protein [Rhodopirellula europaea]|uniref:hypothetical protein n=1 Tax=Rhodopirellula europaea TaxID=1263866 RepID=UPI003D2E8681
MNRQRIAMPPSGCRRVDTHCSCCWRAFSGVASLGLALLIAVESINMAQRQGYDVEFTKGMIVAAGFAFLGSCWAFSCRLYWIRRPRLATVINLVAFGSAGLFWTLLELGVVP